MGFLTTEVLTGANPRRRTTPKCHCPTCPLTHLHIYNPLSAYSSVSHLTTHSYWMSPTGERERVMSKSTQTARFCEAYILYIVPDTAENYLRAVHVHMCACVWACVCASTQMPKRALGVLLCFPVSLSVSHCSLGLGWP